MTLIPLPPVRGALTLVAASMVVAGFGAIAAANEHTPSPGEAYRTNQFYVALGAGISRVEPEADCNCIAVGDATSNGFSLAIGYDFNSWLSGEIYGADLGSAAINFLGQNVGAVDYQVYGASLLGTFYRSNGFSRGREGLSVYSRFGIGGINNDTDLDFRRDHKQHVAFGIGMEYGFSNGLAVRGELNSYDTDAQLVQVSLVKRFGGKTHRPSRALTPAAVPKTPVVTPTPVPEQPRQQVAQPISLPETYFDFDVDTLSSDASQTVADIATILQDVDGLILVQGHADSTGTDAYNQALSIRRSNAVRDALVQRGISEDRLRVQGLGERQPAASNQSPEGRALNRRVEVTLRAQ